MNLPDNIKQLTEAREPEILFVLGGLFFCRRVTLPLELEPAEHATFAELELEENSPFPLEQLAWGFVTDDGRRELWYFAACRPRVPASSLERWESAEHVFPAFLPLVLAEGDRPRVALLWVGDEVMRLEFAEGERFPVKIRARRLRELEDGEAPEAAAREAWEALMAGMDALPEEVVAWTLDGVSVGDDHEVTFRLREWEQPEAAHRAIELREAEICWRADLRPETFIANEQRSRRWQNTLWTSLQAAGWAAVFIALLFLLTWVGGIVTQRRQALIVAQAPAVQAVGDNGEFLQKLRQFSDRPLRPYEVLGMTNEYRPKKAITYRAASVDSDEGVTIQGYGNLVNEINAFTDKLTASGMFVLREDPSPSYRKRGDQTEFTLRLDYTGPINGPAEPLALNEEAEGRP